MLTQDLERRLHTLERRTRNQRRLLAGLVVALAAVPLLGLIDRTPKDGHFRIVYASKFAVQDPRTGKTRATLAHQTMEGGWAGLTLLDDDGRPRAEFKLWEDGSAHLAMIGEDKRYRSRVRMTSQGEHSIEVEGEAVSLR